MKRKLVFVVAMVFIAVAAGSGYFASQGSGSEWSPSIPGGIALVRPVLAAEASFLDQEAGMSAYSNTGFTINLDNAKNAYRIVERQTTDWLIGSVSVPGFDESEDAHVFVHKDGTIVAYYDKDSPVSRTVHFTSHTALATPKLQLALEAVANSAGVPASNVGFFDFRFPNATEWLIIRDNDSFEIAIPPEFFIFERSFTHFATGPCFGGDFAQVVIDGTVVSSQCGGGPTWYGQVTPSLLSADNTSHTVDTPESRMASTVAISLLYIPPAP